MMTSNDLTFAELFQKDSAFYIHSSSDRIDEEQVRALRNRGYCYGFFEAWPYDMKSYFQIVQTHESIRKNAILPLLEETRQGGGIYMWSLPKEAFAWYRSTTLEEITDQWVRFFSTWVYEGKQQLAMDQSPPILHSRIREGFKTFEREVHSHFNAMDDSYDLAWDQFIAGNPPWLDTRNGGEIEGICRHWNFFSWKFYVSKSDIEYSAKTGDTLATRGEADVDAFWFWKAYRNTDRWVLPPASAVSDRSGYVYVLTDGDFYKIGFSGSHPGQRVLQCQTGNPRRISLVGYIRGTIATEKQLHRRFAQRRINGEWFDLTAPEVDEILGSQKDEDEKE